jgi:hypothetical protein
VYKVYANEEINELLSHYEADLKEVVEKDLLDAEHLTRLAQALYVLKSTEFEPVFKRIEKSALRLHAKGQLDIYHVTNLLRAFTHSQENKMCGSDKTFFALESVVLKGLETVNDRDATHLMYAYGVRNVGNPELHAAFEKKLDKIASNLDYPSLFNAFYYLLFRESGNRALFQKLVDATVANPDILPIIYYRPFKAARFYIESRFKEKDALANMVDFVGKHWHAERYFNVYKLEEYIEKDVAYYNFKGLLNARCFVYPISFMTVNNLFLLHFAFKEQKIAVNFHLEKFCPADRANPGPTEMQKLSAKVLKHDGWEILDLSEKEFKNWTYDQRVANITGWLKEAKERQIKKGIIDSKPK